MGRSSIKNSVRNSPSYGNFGHSISISPDNPYLHLNGSDYSFLPWDAMEYNAQFDQLSAEWESQRKLQLEQRQYEEFYNSPTEQVKRMREAGLNPDLLGIDNAGLPGDAAPPSSSGLASSKGQNMSSVFGIINGAVQLFQTIQSSQLNSLDVLSKKNSIINEENNLFDNVIFTYLDDMKKYKDSEDKFFKGEISEDEFSNIGMPNISDYNKLLVNFPYYSNHKNKRMSKRFNQYFHSNKARLLEKYNALRSNRSSNDISASQNEGFIDSVENGISAFLGPILKNKYEYENSNYVEGQKQNSSRTSILSADANSRSSTDKGTEVRRDIVDSLYKSYQSGNIFSGFLLFMYDMFTSGAVNSGVGIASDVNSMIPKPIPTNKPK